MYDTATDPGLSFTQKKYDFYQNLIVWVVVFFQYRWWDISFIIF